MPFVVTLAVLVLGALSVPVFSDAPAATQKASAPLSAPSVRTVAENDAELDARRAEAILEDLAATHKYLEDVTVSIGTTPNGEEAVSYYTDGEIVISSAHTVEIEKILAHEVWHVIDWRDNGRLDWGEDLPPTNSADYL